jgi:uncharacterized membrane protein
LLRGIDVSAIILAMRKLAWAGTGIAAAAALAALASPMVRPRCAQVSGGDVIEIPLSKLIRGATEFFCYRDGAGERIRFILARDADGRVDAVFDACQQCYTFRKGYTVSGDYVICRLCGNRYRVSGMRSGRASCVPVPLPVDRKGDKVEVRVADLVKGSALF